MAKTSIKQGESFGLRLTLSEALPDNDTIYIGLYGTYAKSNQLINTDGNLVAMDSTRKKFVYNFSHEQTKRMNAGVYSVEVLHMTADGLVAISRGENAITIVSSNIGKEV